jgi:hypothetical protein
MYTQITLRKTNGNQQHTEIGKVWAVLETEMSTAWKVGKSGEFLEGKSRHEDQME